jgi:hypothetical protein
MTRQEVEQQLKILINNTGDNSLNLDWTQSKPRLGIGERFISPRLTKSEMVKFMDAFLEGYLFAERQFRENR